jgi:hypothetical protein
MDPNLMTKLRCSCIKNANLAIVFEQLKLAELLEPSPLGLTLKSKADILEAIIGELAEDSSNGSEDLLSALIAYIAYMGDKEYFQEANAGVVSLGEGMTTTPKKTKARRRQRSHKDSGNNPHNNPNTRNIDQKNHGNLSPPAVSNPQKQPLFILTSPKNSIPNNSVNTSVPFSQPPVVQPVIQPIIHPTVQPVLPTRVHNSEPMQIKCNPIALPFINPMNSTTTVLNSNTNNGREPVSTASRNIFFHKMNDVSTSSESSSSSTSLSSSPMNLFLLPNSPIVNGTKNNPRFISYDGMAKPEKMNENKSI